MAQRTLYFFCPLHELPRFSDACFEVVILSSFCLIVDIVKIQSPFFSSGCQIVHIFWNYSFLCRLMMADCALLERHPREVLRKIGLNGWGISALSFLRSHLHPHYGPVQDLHSCRLVYDIYMHLYLQKMDSDRKLLAAFCWAWVICSWVC